MRLPRFNKTTRRQKWIDKEAETAWLIRTLWGSAGTGKQKQPDFLALLVQCGWTNHRKGGSPESTRIWRNRAIANYLGIDYSSDGFLVEELAAQFSLSPRVAGRLVRSNTGITHYYSAFRPATLEFVRAHSKKLAAAFRLAASRKASSEDKVRRVVEQISGLGLIRMGGAADFSPQRPDSHDRLFGSGTKIPNPESEDRAPASLVRRTE